METPDKIYINVNPLGVDYSIVPIPDFGGVEYIRKYALLKWAKEKKKQLFEQESENDEPSDVAAGINAGLDMLIGKLNSM